MTTKLAHLARRTSVVLVAGGLVLGLSGPAGADVPEFWSDPDAVSPVHALLVLAGIPLLLFALITLAVVLPGVIKGERFTPGGQATEDQWFGGPSKGTAALPAPDTEESKAGGASGRW
ncbi:MULTISPECIES: hypothetical protein [unclassified Nocardioides]|uniref:hypothetical protein n=1 Tax=unclassified Nocardioides TaxID=2615069 RepID=UPI0009F0959A|nr:MULTISPECIES: hypothetical protein [unclassified Nocardioides]GAW52290.1 uncharacterized protein (Precursor) [Nocardioides sp. PD653-B2]GAW56025.1 uncharacterized protein (Precursor) [Nocardioides sp. PD653]